MTWAAIAIALLFGVTMSYVPYEFVEPGYELIYPSIRILGLLFGLSGILLLLPRLYPALGWLDFPARVLFSVTLAWLWAGFAVASGFPASTVSLGLLLLAVLLEPFLDRQGIPTFRWLLTALSLALGPIIIVAPAAFSTAVYGFLPDIARPFGVLLLLSGLGLLATARQPPTAPVRRAAEIVSAVLFLALAASAAASSRWIGLEVFLVLGLLDLFLPLWPQLSRPPSLAGRLVRAFTLAVLIPLLVFGAVASYFVQQTLQQQVFAANATIARGAANLVRQYVEDGQSAALVVAREPTTAAAMATWDTPALEGQIRVLYEESDVFRGILLTDDGGTVRVSYPPRPALLGTSLANTPYFSQAMRYGEPATGSAFKSALAGQPLVLPYAIPVLSSSGQTLGVVVALIDLAELNSRASSVLAGQAGQARLVDQEGRIIATSNPAELGQPIAPTDVAAQQALAGKSGVMEVVDAQGTRQLAAYEYVPDLGWALVVEVPATLAYRPITVLAAALIVILAAATLAAIGIAGLLAHQITRPLRWLQEAAVALSRGDLTRRVRIQTGDELELLGNSFNEMGEQLERRQFEVLGLLSREQALARIAQALVRELELGRVVDVVLDQGQESLGADAVELHLADPERHELTLFAYRGLQPETAGALRKVSYAAPLLSARAARTGQIQMVEDLQAVEEARYPLARQVYEAEGLRSLLAVPLSSRGRLVGVATYTTRAPRRFAPRDLEFHATIASLFAVALDNAHVYEELRESLRLREEFLSAAAHELKTPVTTIKGLTEILLKSAEGLRERRTLETIDRQTDRIARLVEDLLAVVRLRPGMLVLHCERFDLAALVREGVERMAREQAAFRFEVEAPGPLVVDADRDLIGEVVRHLLGNAMRYSPSGGAIEVRVRRNDDEAIVSVRDHGAGIPWERQPHVFEPFYEPQPSGAPGYVGIVSLGLYLSKRIIEEHRGRVWFASTPGEGSTFCFSLPLARTGEAEASQG